MALPHSWRNSAAAATAVLALALLLAGCSIKREQQEDLSGAQWRTGTVEEASNTSVQGTEDRDSRIAMGLMGGFVGLAFALGTEDNLGKASVWRYVVRDGETPVRLQSFAVFRPGDCVRNALGGNPADTPMEKLSPESCPAK